MTDKKSEFIEQIFNAISSDTTLSAELKISLLRLQLPIHNLCQSDPHFITNSKHPARQTLLAVKRLSVASENEPSVTKKIDLILSSLFISSPSLSKFSQVNLQLDKLFNSLDTIISGESHKNQLKALLSKKIKHCIVGHEIPAPCQNIVLKLWPNALFYLLKKHGEHSTQWENAITMYSNLLDSIQTLSSEAEHNRLKESFMNIVRSNNNMLLLYHQDSDVEPAIKSLITHFNKLLKTSFNHRKNNNSNSQSTSIKPLDISPAIKPGIWCEIYIDDITPSRRLKLSLINIETGMLIFVNRKGIKKLEKNAKEFSTELERGLSRIYKHDALFTKPSSKTHYKKIG